MPRRRSWHFLTHLSPACIITSLYYHQPVYDQPVYQQFLSHISQFTAVCLCHWHNWTFRHFWSQSFHFLAETCNVLNSVTLWMLLLRRVKLLDSLVFFSLNEHVVCLPEIWLVLMAITFGLVVQLIVCLLLVVVTLAQLIISLLMFFIFMTLSSLLPIFK